MNQIIVITFNEDVHADEAESWAVVINDTINHGQVKSITVAEVGGVSGRPLRHIRHAAGKPEDRS
jgi:dihydroorotate dehydrogenase